LAGRKFPYRYWESRRELEASKSNGKPARIQLTYHHDPVRASFIESSPVDGKPARIQDLDTHHHDREMPQYPYGALSRTSWPSPSSSLVPDLPQYLYEAIGSVPASLFLHNHGPNSQFFKTQKWSREHLPIDTGASKAMRHLENTFRKGLVFDREFLRPVLFSYCPECQNILNYWHSSILFNREKVFRVP
jgi:hypothetical protein